MQDIIINKQENKLIIGENPQLILDLKTQEHYIKTAERKIPYHIQVEISPDLLQGKRKNVFETVVSYYYEQACQIVLGMEAAEKYRAKANTVIREVG